jgi:hypothetical protein
MKESKKIEGFVIHPALLMVGNLKPYFSDPAKQNSNYYLQEVKSLVLNFGKRNNKENNNKNKKKMFRSNSA